MNFQDLLEGYLGLSAALQIFCQIQKEFYNLIDIYNRMLEHHTTNLLVNINNEGQLGKLIHIRINQLQIKKWLAEHPLENWRYFDIKLFKENLIAQILSVINNWDLNIRINSEYELQMKGQIPIHNILKEQFRKFKNQLKKKELLFLDQLC